MSTAVDNVIPFRSTTDSSEVGSLTLVSRTTIPSYELPPTVTEQFIQQMRLPETYVKVCEMLAGSQVIEECLRVEDFFKQVASLAKLLKDNTARDNANSLKIECAIRIGELMANMPSAHGANLKGRSGRVTNPVVGYSGKTEAAKQAGLNDKQINTYGPIGRASPEVKQHIRTATPPMTVKQAMDHALRESAKTFDHAKAKQRADADTKKAMDSYREVMGHDDVAIDARIKVSSIAMDAANRISRDFPEAFQEDYTRMTKAIQSANWGELQALDRNMGIIVWWCDVIRNKLDELKQSEPTRFDKPV